ncbi:MAG: hypothetical protein ACJ741_01220 [Pyrinomonadaceae bacterium]
MMKDDAEPRLVYTDDAQIESLVRGFESCSVEGFNHGAHLAVALWYLARFSEAEAPERMRASLRRFAAHRNVNLYHETLTVFWLKVVRGFLAREGRGTPLCETANRLIRAHADARLALKYFSEQLLSSGEAKASWVEPDLQPLDF